MGTFVNDGILIVNGATSGQGSYTVANGSTLGGTGTVGLASGNSVTLQDGASLRTGNDGAGTLEVSGGLIVSNLNYFYQFDADGPDDGIVSGDLDLNATITLELENVGSPVVGPADTFVLFDAGGVISGFDANDFVISKADEETEVDISGATVEQVGNQIVLHGLTVPEPGTGLLLLAGAGLLLRLRRMLRRP
jgi:hypothetical protein